MYVWTFKPRSGYLRQLTSVDDHCDRQHCKNETGPRCSLTTNGSLVLHDVGLYDAGQYTVTTYHVRRTKDTMDTFILHVLDAITQPVVRLLCLPDGRPVVSCWSEKGTNVSTSIIANGEEITPEGGTSLFNVTSSAPWNISCSISNKVSQKTISVHYSMCPVPLSEPHIEVSCLLDGSVEISCRIDNGSEPSFSWFVNGNITKSSSTWKVRDNVISGSSIVTMNVSCSAKNTISSVHSPVTAVSCPASELYHMARKIVLYFLYNALLISLMRDGICNQGNP
ncbi:uncharacterized protein [Engystomops pustulosus]|uniref:uncharacterized protein n=1 Tax=Engystomops pustulosus TaxID=76066 RepID=UPI003AFA918E